MNIDFAREILGEAAMKFEHIIRFQTSFELIALRNELGQYNLSLDDVQVFIESGQVPTRLQEY